MGERVFKRRIDGKLSKVWYAWVPKPGGGVRRQSTLCTDKQAALVVAAKLERAAVDPDHAAQDEASTEQFLSRYLASRQRLGRAEGTIHHVRVKSGHLLRLLPRRAAEISHARVEQYIDDRLAEGAQRTTVKKELRVLKAALKLAAKNRLFRELPDAVIPELEDDYEPRERFLEPWELVALVTALGVDDLRSAMVAFIVSTGARLGEARRARREDVTVRNGVTFVRIRGTKTKKAKAEVPILGAGETLLAWALARGSRSGVLFPIYDEANAARRADTDPTIWQNITRDLAAACTRAGIAKVSANDLRRTMATWLQKAGVGNDLVAKAMRHVDERMVDRVYGRMSPDDLARLLMARSGGLLMATDSADSDAIASQAAEVVSVVLAENQAENSVPRDGIEPPTRGFSIQHSGREHRSKKQAQNSADVAPEPPRWAANALTVRPSQRIAEGSRVAFRAASRAWLSGVAS